MGDNCYNTGALAREGCCANVRGRFPPGNEMYGNWQINARLGGMWFVYRGVDETAPEGHDFGGIVLVDSDTSHKASAKESRAIASSMMTTPLVSSASGEPIGWSVFRFSCTRFKGEVLQA